MPCGVASPACGAASHSASGHPATITARALRVQAVIGCGLRGATCGPQARLRAATSALSPGHATLRTGLAGSQGTLAGPQDRGKNCQEQFLTARRLWVGFGTDLYDYFGLYSNPKSREHV